MRLLVNVDHIATLRNARGEGVPDPARAAQISETAGAAGVVFHLREDRRHIKDNDVFRLKEVVKGTLDFEMAATDEMIDICARVHPHLATLVPESREELTTEGGLQMAKVYDDFEKRVMPVFKNEKIETSLFIDPVEEDVRGAADLGSEAIELHTGPFANAGTESRQKEELERLVNAAELAHKLGMKVNAGHGLNFSNIQLLTQTVPHLHDVSIGHALMAEAIFSGLETVVRKMARIIKEQS